MIEATETYFLDLKCSLRHSLEGNPEKYAVMLLPWTDLAKLDAWMRIHWSSYSLE
jgi:hypothetical protein